MWCLQQTPGLTLKGPVFKWPSLKFKYLCYYCLFITMPVAFGLFAFAFIIEPYKDQLIHLWSAPSTTSLHYMPDSCIGEVAGQGRRTCRLGYFSDQSPLLGNILSIWVTINCYITSRRKGSSQLLPRSSMCWLSYQNIIIQETVRSTKCR